MENFVESCMALSSANSGIATALRILSLFDDDLRSKAEVGSLKVTRSSKRVEVKFADAALCTEVFSGPSKVSSGSRAALQNAALDGPITNIIMRIYNFTLGTHAAAALLQFELLPLRGRTDAHSPLAPSFASAAADFCKNRDMEQKFSRKGNHMYYKRERDSSET